MGVPAQTLPESATVREAIRLMVAEGIGTVLVVRDGRPVGIFTERDVLRSAAGTAMDQERPLGEAMSPDPQPLTLDAGIAFALNRMIIGYKGLDAAM
jgi:CBS domain-containing protein